MGKIELYVHIDSIRTNSFKCFCCMTNTQAKTIRLLQLSLKWSLFARCPYLIFKSTIYSPIIQQLEFTIHLHKLWISMHKWNRKSNYCLNIYMNLEHRKVFSYNNIQLIGTHKLFTVTQLRNCWMVKKEWKVTKESAKLEKGGWYIVFVGLFSNK